MIPTQCHSCLSEQEIPDHYLHERVKCPACGRYFEALSPEETRMRLAGEADLRLQRETIAHRAFLLNEIAGRNSDGYLSLPADLRSHLEAEHDRLASLPPENWTKDELRLFRAISAIPERQQWIDLSFKKELRETLADLATGIHQLQLDMDIVVPRTGFNGAWASPRDRDES
jgi:hypothetical protein